VCLTLPYCQRLRRTGWLRGCQILLTNAQGYRSTARFGYSTSKRIRSLRLFTMARPFDVDTSFISAFQSPCTFKYPRRCPVLARALSSDIRSDRCAYSGSTKFFDLHAPSAEGSVLRPERPEPVFHFVCLNGTEVAAIKASAFV
jgi:hypothetical protein